MTVRNAATKMSKAAFCATFGVSEKQLERHFQAGMPHEKKGRLVHVPMPSGRVWLHNYLEEKGKKSAQPKTIDEARLRNETAKAEMSELDLADRLAETMKVSEHERCSPTRSLGWRRNSEISPPARPRRPSAPRRLRKPRRASSPSSTRSAKN
jgi:hypothetical protein